MAVHGQVRATLTVAYKRQLCLVAGKASKRARKEVEEEPEDDEVENEPKSDQEEVYTISLPLLSLSLSLCLWKSTAHVTIMLLM
jgi:hypothetical protein